MDSIAIFKQMILALEQNANSIDLVNNKINELSNSVYKLEESKQKSFDEYKNFKGSNILPIQQNNRSKIRELVNLYSRTNGYEIRDCWNRLYKSFTYRYQIDLKARSDNWNKTHLIKSEQKTGLQIAEELFQIDNLFAVATELFSYSEMRA